ncbi:dual specificity testis-specific protein kinase 1 isoform X3 [Pelodiscus sinensis]|uniref:dual specificity testis-specific protein kinase 1 isoform X3 n=1 Tax=Pelodiscus sinensis TaxID=13735 RepID=UPI003F6C892D
MRRPTSLPTASSCARPWRGSRRTRTTCPAPRTLGWTLPLSATWWGTTALRPSCSWPSTAAGWSPRPDLPSWRSHSAWRPSWSSSGERGAPEPTRRATGRVSPTVPGPRPRPTATGLRLPGPVRPAGPAGSDPAIPEQPPTRDRSRPRLQPDPRPARSRSDGLPSQEPEAPPPRLNPFSQRQDLQGGKIKLFDTPSKSVISLTFDLPPPGPCQLLTPEPGVEVQCDFSAPPGLVRKCRSLPASPEPARRGGLAPGGESPAPGRSPHLRGPFPARNWGAAGELSGSSPPPCAPALELTDRSPESPAPEPAPAPPLASSTISTSASGAQPWPPRPLSDLPLNSSVVVSTPHGWGRGQEHSFSELSVPPVARPEPSSALPGSGAVLEQEDVLACPGCCLGPFGFSFASVCHRPAPSPPRYQHLTCEATSLCQDRSRPPRRPPQPSQKLPEAQS